MRQLESQSVTPRDWPLLGSSCQQVIRFNTDVRKLLTQSWKR